MDCRIVKSHGGFVSICFDYPGERIQPSVAVVIRFSVTTIHIYLDGKLRSFTQKTKPQEEYNIADIQGLINEAEKLAMVRIK